MMGSLNALAWFAVAGMIAVFAMVIYFVYKAIKFIFNVDWSALTTVIGEAL